jgi:hypothetical protein
MVAQTAGRHKTDDRGTRKYSGITTRSHTGKMKIHMKTANAMGVFQIAATTVPLLLAEDGKSIAVATATKITAAAQPANTATAVPRSVRPTLSSFAI